MKRRREDDLDIVWQTPANSPERHDYIFFNCNSSSIYTNPNKNTITNFSCIRYVKPYYFEFVSHAKKRWAGKTIVDLFTDEFKGQTRDYYVSAVESGRIQVDGETVTASCIVQPSQKISHFVHMHEPPVMALDVLILQNEPDVLTIFKPTSVPVHPCGQYRKNTIVGILQAEHNLAPLFPIHRLDRLVSGLLNLARSASKAVLFRQQIESGEVEKQYIAKVMGVFPEDEKIVNANVNFNAREGKSTVEVAEDCTDGITAVKGKAACTKFKRISTDGIHSIVSCQPISGRTHQVRKSLLQKFNQIRIHLQCIGHPIANDMLYLSETVSNVSADGVSANSESRHFQKSNSDEDCGSALEESSGKDFNIDSMCTNCPKLAPKGYDRYEEGLWLHCGRYSGPGWAYECPYPDWAVLN